ncbi:MAG: nitroreductase family protein [Planctomycetota bacterium]
MSSPSFVPLRPYRPAGHPAQIVRDFLKVMDQRRSVRAFSPAPIPVEIIRDAIRVAGTAPSGAHKQPWRFVVVGDHAIKRAIREAAEIEERELYARRASPEWLEDLAPLGTDASKPFLEIAPYIIVVFKLVKTDPDAQGRQGKTYYTEESVGIAVGLLLAALHQAGLATLTHTPSPMGFLQKVLGRPEHERAFVVIPAGYPADGAMVPDLERKALDQICVEML